MTSGDLWKSILQYAVQGKLVKQDPNDEPASVLLDRIKQEKEKLIKEGKIKRDKNESVIYRGDDNHYYEKIGNKVTDITDEIPFEIPHDWRFARIGQLGKFGMGQTILTKEMKTIGVPIYSATIEDEPLGYISERDLKVKLGYDNIVVPARGASIGYCTLIKDEVATCTQTTIYCKFYSGLCSKFIYYNLISNKKYFFRASGTAQPQVTISNFVNRIIALPPLVEQQRIVEKLEELEPYARQYESLVSENEKLDKEFPNKLKQSILQYAMQGKLVQQDPNDEPASVLLDRIKQEKEKLIKEGKIKRDKNESVIYWGDDKNYYEKIGNRVTDITDEIPFEIPSSWQWARFNNAVRFTIGATPERANKKFWEHGTIPWVSISDMNESGLISHTKESITSEATKAKFRNKICEPGTLLMSFKLSIGKTAITNISCVHNEAIISIYPYCDFNNSIRDYLFVFLGELVKFVKTTDAIKGNTLNSKKINDMLIPLPPLAEQQRIVNEIELLFDQI